MGCFSFMCKECGKPILSDSRSGQEVTLSLLKDGKIIQAMTGEYDSYGRVFIGDVAPDTFRDSQKWEMDWGDVCDLMFSNNIGNGIAAVHVACQIEGKDPTTRSDDDPNQGWGDDEDEED